MRATDHIGARIATQRKLRGITQRDLAAGTSFSPSLIAKIEQGARPASSAVISAAAKFLQIDRALLTGQPYVATGRDERALHGAVVEVRREVVAYLLPPGEDEAPWDMSRLLAFTRAISAARHRADLQTLGVELPTTMRLLRQASHASSGSQREMVMACLAEVYYAARQFTYRLGYFDLASMLADRYEWAAARSGNPHLPVLATVLRSLELDAAGDIRAARALMSATIDDFELGEQSASQSVWGWLHLMSGYMAAHARDPGAVWAHYAEATEAVSRLGHERDHYQLAFGATNVAIWGTALGTELMDSAKAMDLAKKVTITPQTPPERAGHHYIDLARAQLMHRRPELALRSLLAARSIAPQQMRYHPLVRDVVAGLAQSERRSTSTLRGLAAWMGMED